MSTVLEQLVADAQRRVETDYYRLDETGNGRAPSLKDGLRSSSMFPIIAEVKRRSPGSDFTSAHKTDRLVEAYARRGAAAISVLTDSDNFGGSMEDLGIAKATGLPILMKDVVLSNKQVRAAAAAGASAVLLIQKVFDRCIEDGARTRDELLAEARSLGLEVLLEASDSNELSEALAADAELIGLNQRNLDTMAIEVDAVERMISPISERDRRRVVLMSGISGREQVERARDLGFAAVLIGSALNRAPRPDLLLSELVVPR